MKQVGHAAAWSLVEIGHGRGRSAPESYGEPDPSNKARWRVINVTFTCRQLGSSLKPGRVCLPSSARMVQASGLDHSRSAPIVRHSWPVRRDAHADGASPTRVRHHPDERGPRGNSTDLNISWRYFGVDYNNGDNPDSGFSSYQNGLEIGLKFFF